MPRAPKTPQPAPPVASANGPVGEILSLAEAAAYLRLPEKDVLAATATQDLPGRLINGEWRFLKSAIHQWLTVAQPSAEARKAAQLALAGKFKDDPDLEQIVEDAMRQRGRQPMDDGTYSGCKGT